MPSPRVVETGLGRVGWEKGVLQTEENVLEKCNFIKNRTKVGTGEVCHKESDWRGSFRFKRDDNKQGGGRLARGKSRERVVAGKTKVENEPPKAEVEGA